MSPIIFRRHRTSTLLLLLSAAWAYGCATVTDDGLDVDRSLDGSGGASTFSGGSSASGASPGVLASGGSSTGGSSTGGASSGGSSTGGASGSGGSVAGTGGIPSGSECANNDADCDALDGCHTCELVASVYACVESTTLSECSGSCVDLLIDNTHCGACDSPCSASGAACSGGVCSCTDAAKDICDGACTNLKTDALHCGNCATACDTAQPFCVDGSCAECAGATELKCGGSCVDVKTSASYCGDCDTSCDTGSGDVCKDGICVAGACVGVADWNTTWANNGGSGRQTGTLVVYQGKLYKAKYWAGQGDVPGVAEQWVYQEDC